MCLFQRRFALGHQRRLQSNQGYETFDDEAQEQSDAADVEVALGAEQSHVGLHFVVQVLVCVAQVRVGILAHLAHGVQQEQDEDHQQEREVPLCLGAERLIESGSEQAVPALGRHVRHQKQHQYAHLKVEERRDNRPLETHRTGTDGKATVKYARRRLRTKTKLIVPVSKVGGGGGKDL